MAGPEVCLLVNPVAGAGRAAALAPSVRAAFEQAGTPVREVVVPSWSAAVAAARAAVRDGAGAVASLGGDGVAHAALQAVGGTATPLAVLAAGTGNDLAAAVGAPADPVAAARAAAADLVAGARRTLDLGRAGERWWATVLCCGFDSAVTDRANRLRWPRGPRRYDVALLAELARLRPRRVRLVLDGVPHDLAVTLVAVGNTACYGGGMRICPGADPADGLFDVTVIGPVTRTGLVRARPRLADGSHVRHPAVTVHRARELTLAALPDGPAGPRARTALTAYADGEPVAPLPVTVRCVPGALAVVGGGRR